MLPYLPWPLPQLPVDLLDKLASKDVHLLPRRWADMVTRARAHACPFGVGQGRSHKKNNNKHTHTHTQRGGCDCPDYAGGGAKAMRLWQKQRTTQFAGRASAWRSNMPSTDSVLQG